MPIARLALVVIDCPDPWALAPFYETLTGMRRMQEGPTFVVIGESVDRPGIAFQKATDFRAPRWPDPVYPQQFHLDLTVDDLDAAQRRVCALGATLLHDGGPGYRVFADPVGHPFCLCTGSPA
jgi:predicted enzyme related to lactoylglutathione lyase